MVTIPLWINMLQCDDDSSTPSKTLFYHFILRKTVLIGAKFIEKMDFSDYRDKSRVLPSTSYNTAQHGKKMRPAQMTRKLGRSGKRACWREWHFCFLNRDDWRPSSIDIHHGPLRVIFRLFWVPDGFSTAQTLSFIGSGLNIFHPQGLGWGYS